jgi:hypothetical protein
MTFNILLGDTTELMEEIKESNGYRVVMSGDRRDGWGLYRTSNAFYWDIEDSKIKSKLIEQFMIIPTEIKIYVCFHFRQKEPIKYIQSIYHMIETDLAKHRKQYVFVGLDFKNHKFQKDIKRDLITRCLEIEEAHGTDYCQYYDFYDLEIEW